MSAFKDMVERDLSLFFNLGEIAEAHTVDGKSIVCVLEDATLHGADGWTMLTEATVKLYARTSDLPKRRVRGETIHIDGCGYEVITWTEEGGMTRVDLQSKEVR